LQFLPGCSVGRTIQLSREFHESRQSQDKTRRV
jgi:hypothetical protein